MSKRDFLIFLFKWQGTIFGSFLLVVGLVTTFVYIFPLQYSAVAKVIIETNRSPVDRSSFISGGELNEVMTTEKGIIKSRTVLEDVVDELKPHERPSRDSAVKRIIKSIKQGMQNLGLTQNISRREAWVGELTDYVEAKPAIGSGIMIVSYKDEDPEWAAKIVNSVISNYINHHLRLYRSDGASSVFMQQMNEELNILKQENALAFEDRRLKLTQKINSLKSKSFEISENIKRLLKRLQPTHSTVRRLRDRIAGIRGSISRNKRALRNLRAQENEDFNIKRQILLSKEPFRSLKIRYDNADLAEITSPTLVNVRILDHAESPEKPKRTRLFFIMLSIPAGIFLALTFAFIREYFDRRVLDPSLAEKILGFPELGSVPRLRIPLLSTKENRDA